MLNPDVVSIRGTASRTRVHLGGSTGEKGPESQSAAGPKFYIYYLETQLIVFLIALIIWFTLAKLKMVMQRME